MYLMICQYQDVLFLITSVEDNKIQVFDSADTLAFTCLELLDMRPIAIEVPKSINDIKPYILDDRIWVLAGHPFGRGVMVSKDILNLKQFHFTSNNN